MTAAWAFFTPSGFFDGFPVPDADWVSTLGEYNEHLMRDFGAAELGLAVAGVLAGVRRSRDGADAVLWGFVTLGILHLGYHLTVMGEFSALSTAAQLLVLVGFVLAPVYLLRKLRVSGS